MEARAQLLLRYNVPLQRFFGSRLVDPSDCADLLQDTVVALIEALDQPRRYSNVRNYVFGIARNKLNQHLARVYREREHRQNDEFDSQSMRFQDVYDRSMSSILGSRERSAQLHRLMEEHLSIDDHSMLQLRYWEGLSTRAIGEVFDKRDDAIRSRLHRVRARLRNLIEVDDENIIVERLQQAGEDLMI